MSDHPKTELGTSSQAPPDKFVKLKPASRIRSLRIWFIILVIIGILAIIFVITNTLVKAESSISIISLAYAQNTDFQEIEAKNIQYIVMGGVFSVLCIVYLAAIFRLLFSKNIGNVLIATDLVKTLTGFFVGVGTGFLG